MTAEEQPRIWRYVRDLAASKGQALDGHAKDASRFWFALGHAEGRPYRWAVSSWAHRSTSMPS